jgi:hypothetical protein
MGQTRAFRCTSCDYSAEVSAGDDMGMTVATTTVLCEECQALMDVVTGKREQEFVPITPKCRRRKRHQVTRWSFPGPCPRCHAPMAEDPEGPVVLWD